MVSLPPPHGPGAGAFVKRKQRSWSSQQLRRITPATSRDSSTARLLLPRSLPHCPTPTTNTSAPPGRRHLNLPLRLLLLGLILTPSEATPNYAILGSLVGLSLLPHRHRQPLHPDEWIWHIEARYHLTAYDCSDPAEVQAYSSVPVSHCSIRATPVQKDRPTRFQLLQ